MITKPSTKRLLVAALLTVGLTACSAPPASGLVVAKEHSNGYFFFVSCGKYARCPIWQPASWWLKVSVDPYQTDKPRAVEVAERVWDACTVGAKWHYAETTKTGTCE